MSPRPVVLNTWEAIYFDHDLPRLPLSWRRQQVLDLTHPDAYAYLLARLDALVSEYAIDYLWSDHMSARHVHTRPTA